MRRPVGRRRPAHDFPYRQATMDRRTPTVAELVRRAVEICDPEGADAALGELEEQLEDDDEPVTAVENLEERLALAAEGADYEIENPAVSAATALVLYLAAQPGRAEEHRHPHELLRGAAEAQWHGHPPSDVADWLRTRGAD
jgi:hypothetical protein